MDKKQGWIIVLMLVLILGLFAFNIFSPRVRTIPKWEYNVVGVMDVEFDAKMGKLGKEGWELVSARRAISGDSEARESLYECIFKREIKQ